ncbi:putative polysaccharide biosynthesis protein [Marinobacter nitratireducens]|uniref:Putative polysaccharide biosynthesis protein n=1 Tax=Marinobacter nitratireducens TaxID=1137280 RepID=A0A072N3Z8_9GAMM|nr:MATE family efflux transporter [Marinobacter nitratireducens]KEF32236.1 putative polysaccharide biosynthesis protein [Marinobacter nitratireducens]
MSAKRLITGSGLRTIALIIGMAISFFMMPFLIRNLGDHWYGVWILVASTLGFYGMFDLGIASATQRYIAHALGEHDQERLNSIFSNSLFIYTFIAVIAVLASIAIAVSAPVFFTGKDDAQVFQTIILVMGSTFSIHFIMNAYYGILSAYLRFDIQSYIDISKSILRAITIFLIFQIDASVINLALITVLFDLISQLLVLRFAKREANWLDPKIALVKKEGVFELLDFGVNSLVMFIGRQVRDRGPHMVIAGALSISTVTLFQIASQLIQYINQLQSSILGVLMPSFTRLLGERKHDQLSKNYDFSLKVSALISSCLCGGLISLGNSFIVFWIGPEYNEAYIAVSAMAIGYFFVLLHYPTFQLLVSLAEHKYFSRYELLESLLIVLVTIVLSKSYGISGIAVGIGVTLAVSRFLVLPLLLSMAWNKPARKTYYSTLYFTAISLALHYPVYLILKSFSDNHSFLLALLMAIPLYLSYVSVYVLFVTNESEKSIIKSNLKSLLPLKWTGNRN